MKNHLIRALLAASTGLLPVACAKDDTTSSSSGTTTDTVGGTTGDTAVSGDSEGTPGGSTVAVTADIASDTTWETGNTYVLKQHVFIAGGTLTIEPGVLVKGEAGSSLVVTSTGRLIAEGTSTQPIVFTSAQSPGLRAPGDWGGVVMLGKAPINVTGGEEHIEGYPATEARTVYGGSDAAHNCGSLKYARIEFAGFELAPDNELNGLTMGACGSATQIDFVQVHQGADDGVEIFGGTVNIKHVLITQPDDDGLDWDFGWTGTAQFLVVQQNGVVGDNGIEADNNKNDNGATPRSSPQIWNATFVGSNSEPGQAGKTQSGFLFRRGTEAQVRNSIVAHFTDFALQVNDSSTTALMDGGTLAVKDSIFFDNGGQAGALVTKSDQDGYTVDAKCTAAENNNRMVDPALANALDLDAPSFVPNSDSPALTGGATPPAGLDTTATYLGAFAAGQDWTAGWTAFPAN